MKITLISKSFETDLRGVGTYSKMLYESIKHEKDFNIDLISYSNFLVPNDSHYATPLFSFVELPLKLKKSDIYHALYPTESFYLKNEKSIVTIYDLIFQNMPLPTIKSKLLNKIIMERAMKKCIKFKEIICISEETAKELSEYYSINYEDINIVRPSIDPNFFPKTKKNDMYTIGTVSSLADRKRIDILIKSFLDANLKDSKLLIGGAGPISAKLRKIANKDPRIQFLGFIPDDKMNNFYNSLDVFVFPTAWEGYGIPMIEAMACGKPVITIDDAHIPLDIKKRTHISSINDLANDLKEKSFNCDIKSNLKFAKEHSIEKMKKSMCNIYRDVFKI